MQPLAERLRPTKLEDYIGQKHIIGENAVLNKMINSKRLSSFILWGPPGVGKTTLAKIIANELELPFFTLSAISSGVKDVRETIEKARQSREHRAELKRIAMVGYVIPSEEDKETEKALKKIATKGGK